MRRPWLLPLVPLYGAALWLKRRFFPREARRLAHTVISVGSLSAGGAGKTPVVVALVELLRREGYAVDVLSRGYGRGSAAVERVDPEGTAARFGDEPLELARQTGIAVYVGADRWTAGLLAEREVAAGARLVHVLDDGFQHRRLARDLDVVLLTREDVEDCLLPAGNLREPLGRLRAADVVVLREEEESLLRPVVARLAGGAMPVWVIRRRLEVPANGMRRPVAFCGIARPEGFFALLSREGVVPVETVVFRDHHAYVERDVARLMRIAKACQADGFVTTEKDAVKLSGAMREGLGAVVVAGLAVTFLDEAAVLAGVIRAVETASGTAARA